MSVRVVFPLMGLVIALSVGFIAWSAMRIEEPIPAVQAEEKAALAEAEKLKRQNAKAEGETEAKSAKAQPAPEAQPDPRSKPKDPPKDSKSMLASLKDAVMGGGDAQPDAPPAATKPAEGWPKISAICDYGAEKDTARPTDEFEPFGDWRVAQGDCGVIDARFYWNAGQDQIRVAFEYQNHGDLSQFPKTGRVSYTATINLDGAQVYREDISDQVPFTRWSWKLKEPKIIHDAQQLVDQRKVFPYWPVENHSQWLAPIKGRYKPLGNAGFKTYMRDVGGRQEYGPLTEAQSAYLAMKRRGQPADIAQAEDLAKTIFDQAESAGSWPWNVRDPETGRPIRFDGKYKQYVLWDGRFSEQKIAATMPRKSDGKPWVWDHAHNPAFNYLPYLLTGDPYYLEGLQFEYVFTLGWSRNIGNAVFQRVIHDEQARSVSWSIRDLVHAVLAAPDQTPDWLLSKQYFVDMMHGNIKWLESVFKDGNVQYRMFNEEPHNKAYVWTGAMDADGKFAGWTADFNIYAMGLGVWAGLEEWKPMLDWAAQGSFNRIKYAGGQAFNDIKIGVRKPGSNSSYNNVSSWAEDYRKFLAPREEQTQIWSNGRWKTGYTDYQQTGHGAQRVLKMLGYAEADKMIAWLDSQFEGYRRMLGRAPDQVYKWGVLPKKPDTAYWPNQTVPAGKPLSDFVPVP